MCYHKAQSFTLSELETYYGTSYSKSVEENYQICFHNSGFRFRSGPVIAAENPGEIQLFHWGLIPFWVKSRKDAEALRARTLNAISEEAFQKPSFRDSIKSRRCLVPVTGFFEWRWADAAGKKKYPYFIFLKGQKIFSLAGIYSRWVDKDTGEEINSYSVLTTRANVLMEKIHNHKKRMPVILPRAVEGEWLKPDLTREEVLALCQPYPEGKLDAHTISRLITSRTENTNVEQITERINYPELAAL